MKEYSDEFLKQHVTIAEYPLLGAEGDVMGKFAVLQCLVSDNTYDILNWATYRYTKGEPIHQFVDISMCNPWQRIIISDCLNNAELEWMDFEEYQKDGGKSYKRNQIISQILKQPN